MFYTLENNSVIYYSEILYTIWKFMDVKRSRPLLLLLCLKWKKNQKVPNQRHFVMAALHISSQICRFNIVYSICLWLNRFCSILLNKYQNISPSCPCGWNVDIFRSDLWPQFHKIVTTLDFYDPTFLNVHVVLFPSIYNLGVCSSGPLKF